MGTTANLLSDALAALRDMTAWLVAQDDDGDDWLAAASPYLGQGLGALPVTGGVLAKQLRSLGARAPREADAFFGTGLRFFAAFHVAHAPALVAAVTGGGRHLHGAEWT